MRQAKSSFRSPIVFMMVMLCSFCSGEADTNTSSAEIDLVASTPGDEQIKTLLAISPNAKVDFIKWNLKLQNEKAGKQTFSLSIVFGESQPNTLGFKGGGEKKLIKGEYSVSQDTGSTNGRVYHFISSQLPTGLLLVQLSDELFHVLTPRKQLMVGNGGYSYTINRKQPSGELSAELPVLTAMTHLSADTARQIIFDGRTPCIDIAKEAGLTVAPDCFKLKWKLTLNRDAQTLQPTTYTLRRINSRETDIIGKWAVIKGTWSNPKAVIYQLDADKPARSISLLLGDENVAFFLRKDGRLFTGNEDFSYTLNKRAAL